MIPTHIDNRVFRLLACIALVASLWSCDDGPIYPKEEIATASDGRTIQVEADFTQLEEWPMSNKYSMLVGIVDAQDNDFAKGMYKHIRKPEDGKASVVTFNRVPDNLDKVVIVVSTKSNRVIHTFYSEIIGANVSKEIKTGQIPLRSFYSYVQEDIFNQNCIGCHGDAGRVSAGLDLTAAKSYEMLVGAQATTDATQRRVVPENVEQSYLYQMLANDQIPANANGYNHPHAIDITPEMLSLLVEWISNGAKR